MPLTILMVLIKKDLTIALRNIAIFLSMLMFVLIIIIIFSISIKSDQKMLAGIYWTVVILASILAFNHNYNAETEAEAFSALKIAPVAKNLLFISKVISNFAFLFVLEIISFILIIFFFNLKMTIISATLFMMTSILGTVGISCIGSFSAFCSTRSDFKEILFPIIYLPTIIPLYICIIKATNVTIASIKLKPITPWLLNLLLFDIIYALVTIILFEKLIEE